MFKAIGLGTIKMKKHSDKSLWNINLNELSKIRESGTIGEVIDYLKTSKRPRLSIKVEEAEKRLAQFSLLTDAEEIIKEKSFYDKISSLRSIHYSELIALSAYLDDKTPFSTKHGVKGAQFENVLVVFGRGWNNYNWNDFLEWSKLGIPKGKEDAFERNRNLFYVSCSRPKKKLALVFTQKLSISAIQTLELWFGKEKISNLVLGTDET